MSLTVMELAEEVRESNRRLTQAIDNLSQKFDNLRVELAKDLGAINTNIERFKGRVDSEMGLAKWVAKVITPVVASLFISTVGGAWYLAKLDSRLDQVMQLTSMREVRISKPDSGSPVIPAPRRLRLRRISTRSKNRDAEPQPAPNDSPSPK